METNETVLVSEHNAYLEQRGLNVKSKMFSLNVKILFHRISHSKQNTMDSVLLICHYDRKGAHTVLVYRLNHYVFERHLDA